MQQQVSSTLHTSAIAQNIPDLDPSELVLKALEDARFVWRTVSGLAADTGLSEAAVTSALSELPSDVLLATSGPKGRLYTTRSHYSETQSPWGKFLSAVSGELK